MANSTYSWEDFLKELESSGLRDQFSDADLKLAQANPDVGMSLLGYKKQWNSTTDEQARKRYNEAANALRSSYGGYNGGANGATFLKDPLAPRDFSYKDAPTYENRYDDRIQELLNAVTDREDFSYDVDKDPLFAQYRKQYIREGQRASADAMGQAASMSGGLPSSYAGTAAGQAANYYNAQLTDKVPELEELAYQKYRDDFDMDRAKLSAVENAEQADYQKFLNDLNQYNTDRSFAYGQFTDQLSREERDRETAYQRDQDARARELEEALTGAQYGDYSRLNALGFDTSNYQSDEERQRALEEAQLKAQYGDLSGLKALGVDTSAYEAQLAAANTPKVVYSGSGSSKSSSGSGGGKSQDYSGLYTAAKESENPKSFIANNYKNFGFTSSTGLYDDYNGWLKRGSADVLKGAADLIGDAARRITAGIKGNSASQTAAASQSSASTPELGVTAQGMLGSLRSHPTSTASFAAAVEEALQKGYITEAEASYLLDQIGY